MYDRNLVIQKIKEEDDVFLSELLDYLKRVSGYYISQESPYFTSFDYEEITEEVMLQILNEFPNTKETVSLSSFLRIVFKRVSIDYLSKKTGISRRHYRIIKDLRQVSKEYDIPISTANYYKFHRLLGVSTVSILHALENYTKVYRLSAD